MKKLLTVLLFALSVLSSPCAEKIRIAFLATDMSSPSNAAVFNGLRDALGEMRQKYGCSFEVEYLSADNSPEMQAAQLANASLGEFKAAVVFPLAGADFSEGLAKLKGENFPVASVGARISDSVFSVSTDGRDLAEKIKRGVLRLSKGSKYRLMCYFKSAGEARKVDLKRGGEMRLLLGPGLEYGDFEGVVSGAESAEGTALDYYGDYAVKNAEKISRYDNFGEIFFSPWIIADAAPIKADSDRLFAVCVGSLPQLEIYLRKGWINYCAYDDYYGWGYYAARYVAECLFSKTPPGVSHRALPAVETDPSRVDDFVRDWRRWMK